MCRSVRQISHSMLSLSTYLWWLQLNALDQILTPDIQGIFDWIVHFTYISDHKLRIIHLVFWRAIAKVLELKMTLKFQSHVNTSFMYENQRKLMAHTMPVFMLSYYYVSIIDSL